MICKLLFVDAPSQTRLSGEALTRAQEILNTPLEGKNLDILVSSQSLYYHGFYQKNMGKVPFIKFDKRRKSEKRLRQQMAGLLGRGKFVSSDIALTYALYC